MQHLIIIVLIICSIIISVIFRINILLMMCLIFVLYFMYYLLIKIYNNISREILIKKSFEFGRKNLLNSDQLMIITYEQDDLVWANDLVYKNFKSLLKIQKLSEINLNPHSQKNVFEYYNNIYEFDLMGENLVLIKEVTSKIRREKSLVENEASIGYLQIDNFDYLEKILDNSEFIQLISSLKSKLINYFEEHKIYYETLDEGEFSLIIPRSVIIKGVSSKFENFSKILSDFHNSNYEITLSLGIAYDQGSIKHNGTAAKQAFNLAITRGGGQVVVFNSERKMYFGGQTQTIKGSIRLKARIMCNTIMNIIQSKDTIYLFSHKNPDSDAIASMLLMYNMINKIYSTLDIKIMIDSNINEDLLKLLNESGIKFYNDVTVDKSKNNLAIVLDTQSSDFVANSNVLNKIIDKIVLDHHQTPIDYIENTIFKWVEPSVSSTSEMVCELLIAKSVKISNEKIANFALLAIMTDTSNLRYRTDSATFDVLSFLVENKAKINFAITQQYLSQEHFKIIQDALSKVQFFNSGALIEVYNLNQDFVLSRIVDEMTRIKGINYGVIISYLDHNVKVKVRSNNNFNSKVLIEEYGGGGHAQQAAGILSFENVELLKNKILNYEE